MTAVALLDALVRGSPPAADAKDSTAPSRLAEQLIDASLADLARLNLYEKDFGSPELDDPMIIDVLRSIFELYAQWLTEADQILARARTLKASGKLRAKADQLADACARVHARMGVTPDKLARAVDQARTGQVVPVETIRDELRARLHR